jgi:HD superfamily phosphodiesterase
VLLKDLPTRWTHTEAVARQARLVAGALRLRHDTDVLVAAAYLHDVGYAPAVRRSGFHPLDGAMYLRALGHERLARLVAYHSGARWEAEMRGLAQDLTAFDGEASVVADALTYCDMTTGPSGDPVTLDERLDDVERRPGSGSLVMEALRRAQPELERCVGVIEAGLRGER